VPDPLPVPLREPVPLLEPEVLGEVVLPDELPLAAGGQFAVTLLLGPKVLVGARFGPQFGFVVEPIVPDEMVPDVKNRRVEGVVPVDPESGSHNAL
jgi:hypothetical protein